MKEVPMEQLSPDLERLFETAQRQRVIVTRNGAPFAVVIGVEYKDEEDLHLERSSAFWKMIQERRQETETISLEEFMAELEGREKGGQDGCGAEVTGKQAVPKPCSGLRSDPPLS